MNTNTKTVWETIAELKERQRELSTQIMEAEDKQIKATGNVNELKREWKYTQHMILASLGICPERAEELGLLMPYVGI